MVAVGRQFFREVLSPFIDFVFPPVCISCDKLLPDGHQKVCTECWDSVQPVTTELPLYSETRQRLLDSAVVSDLVSCFVFEKQGAFQRIAHALKYQKYLSLGIELGHRLGGVLNEWNVHADILIPVPLHRVRFRDRTFNQAELVARGVSAVTGIPLHADLVRRKRHTQTQTKLNLEDRRKNMDDAFEIVLGKSRLIENKSCILVDDVITTGATIVGCAFELRKAGTTEVIAASAALAKRDAA